MRALFHHPCDQWLRDRLAALETGVLRIDVVASADGPELFDALPETDVLLHVLHPVTEAMMACAPNLKLIQKIGVGLDAIDIGAAARRDVAVCNMPGTNTQAVAELALALMLAVLRHLPQLHQRLQEHGLWTLPKGAQGLFGEIAGKVVGLVGYGHVARRLETILHALGVAEVLVHSRGDVQPAIGQAVSKAEILRRADILSLHIPETDATRGWLDAMAIARMKPGAILVNTARGGLVDERALIDALRTGRLAGAGLDVFAQEPLPSGAEILSAPGVVTLPHVAWLSRETFDRSLSAAVDNVHRLAAGRDLANRHV